MLLGETIHSGAPRTCIRCKVTPKLKVCKSAAGYYIGTYCGCGPYTRESHYYQSHILAQTALDTNTINWRT